MSARVERKVELGGVAASAREAYKASESTEERGMEMGREEGSSCREEGRERRRCDAIDGTEVPSASVSAKEAGRERSESV